jgi:hypothetical protein
MTKYLIVACLMLVSMGYAVAQSNDANSINKMEPGNCSICGMKLKKTKTQGHDHNMHGGCSM